MKKIIEDIKTVITKRFPLLFGVLSLMIVSGCFIYQGINFYYIKVDYNYLMNLKGKYSVLISEIDKYTILKNRYEVLLNDCGDLENVKSGLQEKITKLDNDIKDLDKKIGDLNKKIKALS